MNSSVLTVVVAAGALSLTAAASGCRDASGPDAVASRFVDAYFVEFDLARAMELADGLAAKRIEHDLRRTTATRREIALEGAKSRVYYGAPERRAADNDNIHYTFPLEVRDGTNSFERKVVVLVAKRGSGFRVVGFREVGERFGGGAERESESGVRPGVGVRTGTKSGSNSGRPE